MVEETEEGEQKKSRHIIITSKRGENGIVSSFCPFFRSQNHSFLCGIYVDWIEWVCGGVYVIGLMTDPFSILVLLSFFVLTVTLK